MEMKRKLELRIEELEKRIARLENPHRFKRGDKLNVIYGGGESKYEHVGVVIGVEYCYSNCYTDKLFAISEYEIYDESSSIVDKIKDSPILSGYTLMKVEDEA